MIAMTAPSQMQQPSLDLFFRTVNAYQNTAVLKAAIELDVFTAIGAGAQTAAAIAKHCHASERGIRILCDYLVTLGFLKKQENRYSLTPDSAMFLDRGSPTCAASAVNFLNSPLLMANFEDLAAVVRKGGTINDNGTLDPEHPIWVEFARAMSPMMVLSAELLAGLLDARAGHKWKVLDIAAGHGMFGVTLARHNPNAEIVAVDWAPVLEVAQANARAAGIDGRHRTLPGSAFEVEFGNGYDLVLLTNFLHHFDPPTCEKVLRKVHAALKPGGRAVTLEFVPNDDRVSPPIAAQFSLVMLSSTPSGDAYTFAEIERMFRNAGFAASELHPLPPTPQQVVISRK